MQYSATVDAPKTELLRSEKYNAKKNRIGFDVEKVAFELWGVNVMRIPGMSRGALLRLVGELGADFTTKFVDVKHFVSWANLVPNNKISGGALLSSKVPKKKNPVGRVFKIASKSYAFFAYSIYAFDYQVRRKVFNRPFLNMAVSSILQPFFEFEVNSSVLVG